MGSFRSVGFGGQRSAHTACAFTVRCAMKSLHPSRRDFGGLVAGAALTASAASAQQNNPPAPPAPGNFNRPIAPDTPAFDGKLEFTRKAVAPRAQPFPMSRVKLLPGSIFHDAQEWNRAYMARLPAERLLYTFRANAGIPPG